MRIVMISAECAPFAKAGGLGDVVHGLSRALIAQGQTVTVLLPAYDHLLAELRSHAELVRLTVRFDGRPLDCPVIAAELDGIPCRLLAPHSERGFFARGRIYGEPDDAERFACFCRAALAYLCQTDAAPDIVHCHDWQTGLIPVLLREDAAARGLDRAGVCYTLHNIGYQGVVPAALLERTGLAPARLLTPERLQHPGDPGSANLMQGGIVYADAVTTVSPRYAWEVMATEQGLGLQTVLHVHADKFGGILNGLDERVWNPLTDPLLPVNYDRASLPGKLANRRALRQRLGLAAAAKPILAIVSRLDWQKGVALMEDGIQTALALGGQVALLGTALDPDLAARFARRARQFADHPDCRLELGYDERLAHLIYAGADLILIPSLYEPCGLTQLIGMRYGTVPVARRVGGLADTLHDANFSVEPFERRNAWLFDDPTPDALRFALERAIGTWQRHPAHFRQLRLNGMAVDCSWQAPAARYLAVYAWARGD